jgi:CspA family cold shock protein
MPAVAAPAPIVALRIEHLFAPGLARCAIVGARRAVRCHRVIGLFSNRSYVATPFEKTLEVNVATGTIKKVVAERGFGFIRAADTKEYFFHRSSLDSSLDFDRLVGGESVEFEIENSPKGPRASRVHAA